MPTNLLTQLEESRTPQKDSMNIIRIQVDGFLVYIGKNGFSNQKLIHEHKALHPRCLWLHALAAGGSHVVLCVEGKETVPDEVIRKAGKYALEYSRSRGTTVRLARLEKLSKPDGSKEGVWQASQFTVLEAI